MIKKIEFDITSYGLCNDEDGFVNELDEFLMNHKVDCDCIDVTEVEECFK